MKHSDNLFRLIRSLTKPEKRYFKLFSSLQKGSKNYIRLFDAIDRQEEYDEEALQEKFRGERFVGHLHTVKNYLYRMILRSLRAYHDESPPRLELRELLAEVEILYERGLFKQARKVLGKARALAEAREDFHVLFESVDWKQKLSGTDSPRLERLDDLYAERKALLREMERKIDYDYLHTKLENLLGNGSPRTPEVRAALDEVMAHPLLATPPETTSFGAHLQHDWTHATYHYGRGEFTEALIYLDRLVERFRQDPRRIADLPMEYHGLLNNMLIMQHRLGLDEEFERALDEMKRTFGEIVEGSHLNTPRLASIHFHTVYLREIFFRADRGEFATILAMVDEIERGLQRHPLYKYPETCMILNHLIACAYLSVGDLPSALRFINRVTDAPEPRKGRNVYYSARLFSLIVHYELGNIELLESIARSTYRFLYKRQIVHRAEGCVLAFFRKILRSPTPDRIQDAMITLRDELAPLLGDPFEHHAFSYFNYVAWLDSRIEGRPLAEMIRRWRDAGKERRSGANGVLRTEEVGVVCGSGG